MERPDLREMPALELRRWLCEHGRDPQLATDLHRLPRVLAARGMTAGDRVAVALRAGAQDLVVRSSVARLGAQVVDIDPSVAREESDAALRDAAPTWIVADSLVYLAGARTPLRRYLRRRGFAMPRLRRFAAHHVRAGRRWPLLVPASLRLDELLADAAHDGDELPPLTAEPAGDPIGRRTRELVAQVLDA